MSYKTYTTKAVVVGSRVNNTSDKSFLLFTREAGILWASAKSVREERSKQRFALQDFSLIRVSLVKGKSGWRIGSVAGEQNFFATAKTKPARGAVTSVIKLLRQFMHGEVIHQEVFDDATETLRRVGIVSPEELDKLIEIFNLRFLFLLGYIAPKPTYSLYLESNEWWSLPPLPKEARSAIDRANKASHL